MAQWHKTDIVDASKENPAQDEQLHRVPTITLNQKRELTSHKNSRKA